MSTLEAIESIQAAMAPLETLQGEHSQLEAWVHDSFGALEKLHGDLTDWQSELARKQTELDLREDSLDKCQNQSKGLNQQALQWKQDLELAREEVRQLEEENGEQLQELERLERRHMVLEAELKSAHERTEQLASALEVERKRTTEEHQRWAGEFLELRELLEEQRQLLEDHLYSEPLLAAPTPSSPGESGATAQEIEEISRAAELRRRAQSRRAAKNRQIRSPQDPGDE